ncbi:MULTISPECIES: ErmE/ErmH/ErmO/ErmR family 23S rRNA (adenine(2058)-N(6))-methyltransferase [Micromonospora]|uniref:ErmE/ErmH/ErmO/ErmR family 23S rRNA (Adenine(2058)-N(6))-methyltransferase n=1 Tax=Micromonospora solifontis TaxID=2487138 RepID=A0ABX9WAZ1_9ACTN|nr:MULTISPECIES: ErmE/ErmH/ErmO/ErmR family 23S rRNA (adenine(2058)-N(6))-methyltransferase [Micromonospora]NES16974.1 ErmE/ErmH/ErmO/ErmR family 23S rRNA (adenine(2058)-N(6))-methyltransferase [Micromonospora sp. PPF5-17B]NES39022.1 ErmE/ErmH/ErmO/ErmR family 23S rRNA (adenine(2058)-N(6))-methyltransferase [Micromonospora solifontis]NES58700.1 ErmE/ErmH/ErmO/ErmR family 23S rRNA (adenine(2058)-N(6))-methyltransferase [Micromonospora sp. PPF5-6]RNL91950.1 ErmE/ErmH/ErmO/ErmR family 23S rRNA (ad
MAPRRPTARDRSRRVLSQNFLADPAAVARVVRAARLGPDDLLLEVGAGRGRLTRPLAARCGRLIAYEVDPAVLPELAATCADLPRVEVRPADFLAATPPAEPFAVVGNIPWSLTAAVVRWCLAAPGLRSATLLTQLEYARKRAGDRGRWSRLTVLTWPERHWRLAGRVPRTAFRPVPAVDGGILRVDRRPAPLLPRAALPAYRRMVELGFGGVGGSLAASLRTAHPARRVAGALRAARLDPDTPVGLVWPEQWLVLFRLLHAVDPGRSR